jgi:hypothetical protein
MPHLKRNSCVTINERDRESVLTRGMPRAARGLLALDAR